MSTNISNLVTRIGVDTGYSVVAAGVTDINNPPKAFILHTAVNPTGLPSGLGGNACVVLQQNPASPTYSGQLAFSFSGTKIAVRGKDHTGVWGAWKYVTLS